MRKVLFLICVLGLSCGSWAQTTRDSWTNLSVLQAGQKIQIIDLSSKKHSGTFLSVSDTAISYQEAGSAQTIAKQDVRSVKLANNKHRLRNTFIGAAVGGGAGAGIGAAAWENHGFFGSKGVGAGVGAVIGLAGGAIVGALLPSHQTIYSVNSR